MIEVAVDNSVISYYCVDKYTTDRIGKDKIAFKEMINLHKKKIVELGGPWTTLKIENLMKSGRCREVMLIKLQGVIRDWPVYDNDPADTERQVECLHKIMQDPNGNDSRQLVIISKLTQSRHFVTMDYRFYRQFNHRKKDIMSKCGMNIFVMTPLEFIKCYNERRIS